MKPAHLEKFLFVPQANGWRVVHPNGESHSFSSVEEAASTIPVASSVHLLLPVYLLLMERMRLPLGVDEELADMALLQLEKTLSYPISEVAFGIQTINSDENAATLMVVASRKTLIEALAEPLRSRPLILEEATPYVAHVAASCANDENVLCVYREHDCAIFALAARGKLAWVDSIPMENGSVIMDDVPQILLAAEMNGADVEFSKIFLEAACESWTEELTRHFRVPVEPLEVTFPLSKIPLDLIPYSWRQEAEHYQNSRLLKQLLLCVGALYLALVAGAGLYLWGLKHEVGSVDAEVAAMRPRIEALQRSQERWKSIAPAVEPDRTTIELLYLLCKNIPQSTLRLTEFDQSVMQWKVSGEAANAGHAVEYLAKLKGEKGLSDFRIIASPPSLLPNDQAQFSIFGKR